jgi:hypothetical protein
MCVVATDRVRSASTENGSYLGPFSFFFQQRYCVLGRSRPRQTKIPTHPWTIQETGSSVVSTRVSPESNPMSALHGERQLRTDKTGGRSNDDWAHTIGASICSMSGPAAQECAATVCVRCLC